MTTQNVFKITFYDIERGEAYTYRFLAKTIREALDIAEEYMRERELSEILNIKNDSVVYVKKIVNKIMNSEKRTNYTAESRAQVVADYCNDIMCRQVDPKDRIRFLHKVRNIIDLMIQHEVYINTESKILDFSEALYELKEGKKIARLAWDKTCYVKMSDGRPMLYIGDKECIEYEDSNAIYGALMAQDWEVIE